MTDSWAAPGPAWLFCPADRPDRYAKAAAAADLVIIDLEDAVAPQAKDDARRALVETTLDPAATAVRLNPSGTEEHEADLLALARTPYRTVMLAKTESGEQVERLTRYDVIVLLETALGVVNAVACAAARPTVAVMWGAEDLVAGMGGTSSRTESGAYRDVALHARSTALLAASAAGRVPVDAVYLDFADDAGLRAETEDAMASGFGAKVAIHPRQVDVIRDGFRPSPQRLEWAQAVLAAGEQGVFRYEGQMVDAPLLRQAEAVVRRAR
jgi:citrate lyase subunit beta/citryl-CoA lyase